MKNIIACEVFFDELRAVLPPDAGARITWVEAALHTDMIRLEASLRDAISQTARGERIILLYGERCLPWRDELLNGYKYLQCPGNDCIDILLEKKVRETLGNVFPMTPGWVRAWPSIMKNLGWNDVDVRINLGRYERIMIFDPGIRPLTEDEILNFFDVTGVYVELMPLNLLPFRHRIEALLDA